MANIFVIGTKNILEGVLILDSSERKGLQIADAIAYCTTRYLTNHGDFDHLWNVIEPKIRRSSLSNKIEGYGLIIFPKN